MIQLSMIHFIWPWVFGVFPLPWVLRILLPRAKQLDETALRVPYVDDFILNEFTSAESKKLKSKNRYWPLILYTMAWLCLLTAAARPQWVGDAIELPVSGRDLLLAIDLSKSMELPFRYNNRTVSRIAATKAVASQFIEQRVGDRIGLILFGDQAYVQVPLTFDRTTVDTLLKEAVTGLAGNATAIGDAIGLAVKRLQEDNAPAKNNPTKTASSLLKTPNYNKKHPHNDRVLILMTDGVNNAGQISPRQAAALAARKGLKIYTIGIGNPGSRELDENTLRAIAKITGGRYFRADSTSELIKIYKILDRLEPVAKSTQTWRPVKALFYIPLAVALIIASLLGLLLKSFSFIPDLE